MNNKAKQKSQRVIKDENPEDAYKTLMQNNQALDYDTRKKLCAVVIKSGNIELAVKMATEIENVIGLEELEKRLIRTEKIKQIFLYLIGNNSRDKTKLEQRLRELKSAEFSCKYIKYLLSNWNKRCILEYKLAKENSTPTTSESEFNQILDVRITRVNNEINENKIIVLESKNPEYVYELVSFLIGNSYIKRLKTAKKYIKAVIECGNAEYINKILKLTSEKIPDINISEYKPIIIQSGNTTQIYEMAKMLNGLKNNDLEAAILNSTDIETIILYARDIQNIDIKYFTKKIIESGDYNVMTKYAREILNKRHADINDVQEAIIRSKNTEIITNFAKEVKGADVNKCFECIYKSKSIDTICEFAKKVKEGVNTFDTKALSKRIKNKNNAHWSYGFITNFVDTDFEDHRKIILDSEDAKWNCEFIIFLNSQDEEYKKYIEEHANVVIKSNNIQYIRALSGIIDPKLLQENKRRKNPKYKKPKNEPDKKDPVNDETRPEDLENIWLYHNIKWIIDFSKKFSMDDDMLEKISKKIIEENNPKWSWEFLQRFGKDLEEHKKIMYGTKFYEKYEKRYGTSDETSVNIKSDGPMKTIGVK